MGDLANQTEGIGPIGPSSTLPSSQRGEALAQAEGEELIELLDAFDVAVS